MTELEQLTQAAAMVLSIPQYNFDTFAEAMKDAYTLGRHDAYANQRTAARENGKRGGRPKGSKDKSGQPRTRRSKAEIEKEVKP